jgi:hypothetical protein
VTRTFSRWCIAGKCVSGSSKQETKEEEEEEAEEAEEEEATGSCVSRP